MYRFVLLVLAGLALFGLAGCEAHLVEMASGNDPSKLGSAAVGVFVCMSLMLYFCADDDFVPAILGGARLTGLTALLLAPFRLMSTADFISAGALAFAGILAVVITTAIMQDKWWDRLAGLFRRKQVVRSDDDKERELAEMREKLQTAQERLDQQEARTNRLERKSDGQEGPYGR